MKRTVAVTMISLVFLGLAFAVAEGTPPVDEATIENEIRLLQDRTPRPEPKQQEKAQDLIARGIKAHDAREYDKAIALYRRALEVCPLHDPAYYELAFSYSATGRQIEALDAITRAVLLNPKLEQYYILQGSVLDDLGEFERALTVYERLLSVQPNSYMGHLNLAVTLARQQRTDEAMSELQRAVEIDPNHPSAYYHLATLSRRKGWDYDERDYIEKFLSVGAGDRRRPQMEKRLEELKKINIEVDPNDPHSSIAMAANLTRATWRGGKHRATYPEAHGYAVSFEEDKATYTLILDLWRKEKTEHPDAQQGFYDLLLKIDDTGYLDEYIYYNRQRVFGEPGRAWLEAHKDRVDAFLAWAMSNSLLGEERKPEPPDSVRRAAECRAVAADLFARLKASSRVYKIGETPQRADALVRAERERYAKGFSPGPGERLGCHQAMKSARARLGNADLDVLYPVFRCFLPGDDEYEEASRLTSTRGMTMVEIAFLPAAAIQSDEEGITVAFEAAWLGYVTAKAGWRHEPELRSGHAGPEDADMPTLEEELFALSAAYAGYKGLLEPSADSESKPIDHVPALDRLVEAVEAGHLRGYALFEVIHKAYGVPLDRLAEKDAGEVARYLWGHVIRRSGRD